MFPRYNKKMLINHPIHQNFQIPKLKEAIKKDKNNISTNDKTVTVLIKHAF